MEEQNLYQTALAFERELAQIELPEPKELVFSNSKTGQAFRSLVSFCEFRTKICQSACYACKGRIAMENSVKKAIAVRRWIEKRGTEEAARKMAAEVDYQGIFRWMDRGEWDPVTVDLANKLVKLRPDVKFSTFSRNLEALKALDERIARIYSMDAESLGMLEKIPKDMRIAYLKTKKGEEIPERVSVVFPRNHKKELRGHEKDCSFASNPLMKCYTCLRCYR